jgi:hypothetical protein
MVFSAGFRRQPGKIGPRQIIDHVMVESTFSSIAASTSLNKRQIKGHGANKAAQDE